jgi:hypothetical protein
MTRLWALYPDDSADREIMAAIRCILGRWSATKRITVRPHSYHQVITVIDVWLHM